MPLRPHDRLGPYEVVSPIGSGGMGEVYKARDTRLGRTVAIKVLPAGAAADPERRRRFEQEARAASALNHPHICVLHDIGHDIGEAPAPEPVGAGFSRPDVQFLVMEHLDGPTLAARLAKGPLPLSQALEYAAQIADALAAAHKSGILHRDLKPGNVMLTKTGAKLLDFGLAKLKAPADVTALTTAAAPSEPATAQGVVLGTVPYMAPEQLEGKATDARSDLFAFGAMLYEMVTGRRAFEGTSAASVIAAILASEPPPVSALQPLTPPALDRLVRRRLAKSPDERWDTAHDVADELRWIREGAAAAVGAGIRPRSPRWRGAAVIVAVAVIGAVAGATVLSVFRPLRPTAAVPVVRTLLHVQPAEQLRDIEPGLGNRTAGGSRTALAWTPDGRTLVFVGRRGHVQQLYARELDREKARSLAGTEDARCPVVSPDGQWVAFWAGGAIKKVALAGGPPITIIDGLGVAPVGMSWGENGRLAYANSGDGLLWEVPADGRQAKALTTLGPGERQHVLPHLLPGGGAVLFTARKYERIWSDEEIVAQSLTTGERKVLIRDATDARFVGGGYLVSLRRGALLAVAFDPANLEIRGSFVPLFDGVAHALRADGRQEITGAGQFSVAPTGVLAYVEGGVAGDRQRALVTVDRHGEVTRLAAPVRHYSMVRVSPDGRHLAVGIRGLSEQAAWLYDLGRGALTKLTPGGEVSFLLWTPDGKRLTFAWGHGGMARPAWQIADGSGSPEEILGDLLFPAAWSPDAKRLLGFKIDDEDVWELSLEQAPPRLRRFLQDRAIERWPVLSPDGRWLAYGSDVSGRMEVYLQPYPGPGPRVQVSVEGGTNPLWNPSGHELFFSSLPDNAGVSSMMLVPVETGATPRVGTPRRLFEWEPAVVRDQPVSLFDVAPDGLRFYAIQQLPEPAPPMVTHIRLVLNWFEELKGKVPAR